MANQKQQKNTPSSAIVAIRFHVKGESVFHFGRFADIKSESFIGFVEKKKHKLKEKRRKIATHTHTQRRQLNRPKPMKLAVFEPIRYGYVLHSLDWIKCEKTLQSIAGSLSIWKCWTFYLVVIAMNMESIFQPLFNETRCNFVDIWTICGRCIHNFHDVKTFACTSLTVVFSPKTQRNSRLNELCISCRKPPMAKHVDF